MKARKRQISIITLSLLIPLIFMASFAELLYDRDFYYIQYSNNEAYARVSPEIARQMTEELLLFLKGDGKLGPLFSERERLHLEDVRVLVRNGFIIFYSLLFVIVLLLSFLNPRSMALVFFAAAIGVIAASALAWLFQGHFSSAFLGFHHVFFSNDLWLLDPAHDRLILLLPEPFFQEFVRTVFIKSVRTALVFAAFGLFLRKK